MRKIEAALFDFDGTLVNSEWFHFDCWNMALNQFDISLAADFYENHFAGVPTPINAKYIVDTYRLSISVEELTNIREAMVQQEFANHSIELMPYAQEIIEWLYDLSIPMVIVTGSPRNDVDQTLHKLNWDKYFEFAVTRDDVTISKPDAESYSTALNRLNLGKEEVLAFEDTENGLKSAKAAGLTCYGIQSNLNYHHKLSLADGIFLSLEAVKNHLVASKLV